jgi:uncharacterized delta-60 repeat protein
MNNNIQICRFQNLLQMLWRIRIVVLVILLCSNSIFAAPTLDPNFGTGGKVSFHFFPTSSDFSYASALQADGKIVIVGTTYNNANTSSRFDFAVARLNADGSLDNTFGSGGRVNTELSFFRDDSAVAVVLQPDGKIVVGGPTYNFMGLARYNSDGSLDKTFGTGGKVVTDIPEGVTENITYLLSQADGKIIAVGSISGESPEPQTQIILVRYNSNGSIDASFGTGGKFKINLGKLTNLNGAALQPDGKILISGNYTYTRPNCTPTKHESCLSGQAFVARYNQQLQLDRKFGRRLGKEFTPFNGLFGIAMQTDGGILFSAPTSARRYSTNGRLDTIFEEPRFPNQDATQIFTPFNLTPRPNGTIVGCGRVERNGVPNIGVALFNADGRVAVTDSRDFFGNDNSCSDILLQPDGKIVIVGYSRIVGETNHSIFVMRYSDFTP